MLRIILKNTALVVLTLFFFLFVSGISYSATVQNFDDGGSTYTKTGSAAEVSGGPSGKFMRLVPTWAGQNGAIYFNTTDPFPARKSVAEFDFRMFAGTCADGFSITFLNTANYPDGGTPSPNYPGVWEEPNFNGSLGIGFDIWWNPEHKDLNHNHISVHFDSKKVSDITFTNDYQLWRSSIDGFDHAKIIADLLAGTVSIYITPLGRSEFTVVENLSVPGLSPYQARVAFGARTGAANANHDIDNINVQFYPVPIPSALLLLASGLAGVFGLRRRMK